MIKKGLLNLGRKGAIKAVLTVSLMMLSASFSYADIPAVYADNTDNTDNIADNTADNTADNAADNAADKDDTEEVQESDILEPKLGRVEFWDWKRLTSVKEAFGDNKYHPVLFLSLRDNSYGKASFLSSYSDRSHVYLPTYTNRWNSFSDQFPSVPGNPETTVSGKFGYYGRTSSEAHSPAYYMDAEETIFYHLSEKGRKGLDVKYRDQNRFFTTGTSMGVPWLKVSQWGPDGGRTMVYMCFPKKELSGGEAMLYQPDSSDYFLYVAAQPGPGTSRWEPMLYATHTQDLSPAQDNWHLITYDHSKRGVAANHNVWAIVGLNNSYENSVSQTSWGANILNGNDDSCVLTMFRDKDIEIIPQGTKSDPMYKRYTTDYLWYPYVGTPHLFTSLVTQTIEEGKILPITAGTYMEQKKDDDKDKGSPSKTEGLILPKGETLTIDGGTVYVDTNFIHNGKIRIINGGTLVVKKGGCISPYTDQCAGEGTIECDGGNIVVMPGGRIYGFCTGITKTSNPYNQTNAPLRLVGGGTMINYGTVVLTYGVVGKGSKIEVRKDGELKVGYNRKDALEMMANNPGNIGTSDPANYKGNGTTIGLFGVGGYWSDIEANSVENTTPASIPVTIGGIARPKIGDSVGITSADLSGAKIGNPIVTTSICTTGLSVGTVAVAPGIESFSPAATINNQNQNDTAIAFVVTPDYEKATVVVEKTAKFDHAGRNGLDTAPKSRVDIIVPEY